jgi:alpha-L-fucosidase 2
VNGDQIGTGLSRFRYRPFTLEGNFLAMEAVHDMVLQSWPVNLAEDPTPVIRIFPAMPWRWHQASFRDLRAEGGFVVSATRENNATTRFEIRATVDSQLRLRDNLNGREPAFDRQVTRDACDFVLNMQAGETLVGTLDKPSELPPEPNDSIDVRKRLERIEELHAAKMRK